MTRSPQLRDRAGMTLVEVIIALSIFGVVIAGALGFVSAQNTAFHRSLDRMSVLRNARYVVDALSRDVPTAGTNVPARQPTLVYGGENVVAFSADYATNVANDVFAVYIDPDAPSGQVTVPTSAVSIPNTSWSWPDSAYETSAGTPSPAASERFTTPWKGTSTSSRNSIIRVRYFRQVDFDAAPSILDSIPRDSIPIWHSEPWHGAALDQGVAAIVDRVRAVRVSFRATNGLEGGDERIADVSRLIAMPNSGRDLLQTCGSVPLLGSGLTGLLIFTSLHADSAAGVFNRLINMGI